jgi:two-component system chemotaxis response regulator CheB
MTGRQRDIVVIGASAGGVGALKKIVRGLPKDFPGATFVVLHVPAEASHLPEILAKAGPLVALHPRDAQSIAKGHIYIAPPGHHLLVERGHVRLDQGPRENGHRPAVDPLFRSAAVAYGPRVIALVLSGTGDDGSAGLLSVRSGGGKILVQDPEDALHRGMPLNALRNVGADWCLPLSEIPGMLVRLASTMVDEGTGYPTEEIFEKSVIAGDKKDQAEGRRADEPSLIACPNCGGSLWEIQENKVVKYRCHVGHVYSLESLATEHAAMLESALWRAVRMFEERAMLARRQGKRASDHGLERIAQGFEERARDSEESARLIRVHLLKAAERDPGDT